MRPLSSTLLAAQRSKTSLPYIRITLTRGQEQYVYHTEATPNRVMLVSHTERPYGGAATIRLQNSDSAIGDLKGFRADIGYGFFTSVGPEYSVAPPLWVYGQRDISSEGVLITELECIDRWQQLSMKTVFAGGIRLTGTITGGFRVPEEITTSTASAIVTSFGDGYVNVGRVNGTFSTGQTAIGKKSGATILISAISTLGAMGSVPGYAGRENETIKNIIAELIYPTELEESIPDPEGLPNIIKPDDYFTPINTTVTSVIQDMLLMCRSVLRMGQTKMYMMYLDPNAQQEDYEYDIDKHVFWSNVRRRQHVLPNVFIVINNRDKAEYVGTAVDSESVAAWGNVVRIEIDPTVTSTSIANARASYLLARERANSAVGELEVPHNCGQELYDLVKIVDSRAGVTLFGRVGELIHTYAPGHYRLRISLGSLSSELRTTRPTVLPANDIQAFNYTVPSESVKRIYEIGPDQLRKAMQPYTHDITFTAVDWDTVSWTAGEIYFADKTKQSISSGSIDLPDSLPRWIYFTTSSSTLAATAYFNEAVAHDRGILALVQRAATTDQKALVLPSAGKTPLLNSLVMTANMILAEHIKAGVIDVGKLTSTVIARMFDSQTQRDNTVTWADDPAARINVKATVIEPGKISIVGKNFADLSAASRILANIDKGTILEGWIYPGMTTIDGGKIHTETIKTSSLRAVPTANFIDNGSFEHDRDGWTVHAGPDVWAVVTTNPKHGNKYIRGTAGGTVRTLRWNIPIYVDENDLITMQFWLAHTAANGNSVVGIFCFNRAGTYLGASESLFPMTGMVSDIWYERFGMYKPIAGTYYILPFIAIHSSSTTGFWFWDDIRVYKASSVIVHGAIGGARVIIGPDPADPTKFGIYGMSDATTKQFYLEAATGKAMCGGGDVILDAGGVTIRGEMLKFRHTDDTLRGWIKGYSDGLYIYGYNKIVLTGLDRIMLNGIIILDPAALPTSDPLTYGRVYRDGRDLKVSLG